ncbi:hypothetical protein SBA3_1650028 [Candidatus Sulfopaludibacter sp. SbA3]|nr:hypothetical protein SBA3_1650028 [Candidatus Sulfopaludibacter sp. SbA3]
MIGVAHALLLLALQNLEFRFRPVNSGFFLPDGHTGHECAGDATATTENLLNCCGAPSRHRNCYDLSMLPTIAAGAGCLSILTAVQQRPGL